MITSKTLKNDASDCKIILSHAGGTLASLVGRVAGALSDSPFANGMTTEEIMREAGSFYFDTALSSHPASPACWTSRNHNS